MSIAPIITLETDKAVAPLSLREAAFPRSFTQLLKQIRLNETPNL